MTVAQTTDSMSPGLLKVIERARRYPKAQFNSLAHLIDPAALERAYRRLRKDAAIGVDGITKDQYGQSLEGNLAALHERLRAGQYRHQPIRRVHIPKPPDKTRPIGISTTEDKIVQGAIRDVLEAIYEQDFLPCSFGFRPGRGAHDALRALRTPIDHGEVNWILEADIQSYFDSLHRDQLVEMLRTRIADTSLLRLIGKCLHVGILDGADYSEPDEGTVQGSSLSPLLGNVYLHHVLDLWFEHDVRRRLRGRAILVRYADDFVIGFERRDDAERVTAVIGARMARYGLTLHPDKTRLMPFGRPERGTPGGKGPATLDFLGFTLYWRRTRRGSWVPDLKTRTARLRRAIQAARDFCRRHRHESIAEQRAGLARRLEGHFNYFGVQGNFRSLAHLVEETKRAWYKWLKRRSQRGGFTWERFGKLLKDFPLPRPTIRVQIWVNAR
jgi:group II intron reverse transcriptase/maturase